MAEDITQDAFVRVSGRLAHLREGGAFDAYLRRAVVNLSKNHFRLRAVERAFLERASPALATPGHEQPFVEREATMAALARLPQRQRAAIVLRFYEDLTEDAIARSSVPGRRVSWLVTRGVQALRADIQRYADPEHHEDVRPRLFEAAWDAPTFAPAPERTVDRARRRAALTISGGVAVTVVAAVAIVLAAGSVPSADHERTAVEGSEGDPREYVIDVATGEATSVRVLPRGAWLYDISPDGSRIAFTTDTSRRSRCGSWIWTAPGFAN